MMPLSLEARIEQLERQAKRLRRYILGLLAAALVAISFVATGAEARAPKDIVANSIKVAGKTGRHGATIAASDDGFVGVYFHDANGELRMALMMTPSGKSVLSFSDGRVSRLEIGVVDNPTRTGQEYSLNMRDSDATVIWRPTIANPL
jgi:hypothetical protein